MKIIVLILISVLVLLQYRLWYGNGSIPEVRQLEKIKQEQILENKVLQERNRSLSAEVLDLKTGLEAIEERARMEMGMIKHGEVFYQIVMPGNPADAAINNK